MSIGLTADDLFYKFLDNTDLSEDTKNLIVDAIEANNEKLADDIAKLVNELLENK